MLNWNAAAIGFYRARAHDRWTNGRSIGSMTRPWDGWLSSRRIGEFLLDVIESPLGLVSIVY